MSYIPITTSAGYTPQSAVSASRSLSAAAATTVVDVTEAGIVESIVIETTSAIAVSCTATLKFTIDGSASSSRTVISGTTFQDWVLACPGNGDGSVNNDRRMLPITFPYSESLKVEAECTVAGVGAGTLKVTVLRSKSV
ncbi:MAG: hypothetical protein E6Q97_03730 [Desulfurellales bacterium]|nr:MAG: hypothetical protein E6Q97_03730 [Desulfurellales bacterium]